MADQIVALAPNGAFAFRVMVDLGGVSVRLRFRWQDAISAWTLLVETPAGEALSMQAMVRAGARVLLNTGNVSAPPGALRWAGRDPTTAEDLGTGLLLVWAEPE